jgi:hypothetical protein
VSVRVRKREEVDDGMETISCIRNIKYYVNQGQFCEDKMMLEIQYLLPASLTQSQ